MNAHSPAPTTRRRRRGLKTLALIGLAVVGLSACGGRAYMAVNGPNFPAEYAEGLVEPPGLKFVHDANGKVVSIVGVGQVPRPDGSKTTVVVDIQRKANGVEYAGTLNYKLKNGHDCDWVIDDDPVQVGTGGLAGVAVSYCENAWSSAAWRFDPT